MIRNGLYATTSKALDGAEGGATGVSVVQNGTMRGGGSIYYHVGNYTCSNGKWKGSLTIREHAPDVITALFARKVVTIRLAAGCLLLPGERTSSGRLGMSEKCQYRKS